MRAHKGAIHKTSPESLDRYVVGSEEKHDIREADTAGRHTRIARRLDGKRFRYQSLIASNGLPGGARSGSSRRAGHRAEIRATGRIAGSESGDVRPW